MKRGDRVSRPTAEQVIARLGLVPLFGEGGMYKENYFSAAEQDGRPLGSAIY